MITYSESYRKSRALLVGIDKYADNSFRTLDYAENDANSMATLLMSSPMPFEVDTVLGQEATRQSILSKLYALRDADPDDRIIVFYAGHGFVVTDRFGKEKGYLAAQDSDAKQEFTSIALREILELRKHTNAKHIGFVFDSCFSGQALGLTRASTNVAKVKYLSRRAYQVITGGAGDQTVLDNPSMTTRLIHAIESGLARDDDVVTFSSLGLYLKQTLASEEGTSQLPQFGHLDGSQGGEFVLDAAQAYWSPKPKVESELGEGSPGIMTPSIPEGVFSAEVDLSGRIDALDAPTVLSISAGLYFSLLMTGTEKQEALNSVSNLHPKWSGIRKRILLYTLLLYYLLRDHVRKLDHIEIDNEYPGRDDVIKGTLLSLLRGAGIDVSRSQIRFTTLGKSSPASIMASRVYRGEQAPDWVVTSDEILFPILR